MKRKVEIEFDAFGWEALTEEARSQGIAIEDLVTHAAMFYLARCEGDPARRVVQWPDRVKKGSHATDGDELNDG